MADEHTTNDGQQDAGEPEGTANPTTPAGNGEHGQSQTPPADNGDTGEETIKDSHGQPGINKERHDREMAEKDAKIAELEAKIAEASATKERADELQKEIDGLKQEQADSKIAHALEMAGCVDVKAAKARLDDFDGDVAKLKEACPYLFGQERKTGSTGAKHTGAPDSHDQRVKKAREAAGLKPKE